MKEPRPTRKEKGQLARACTCSCSILLLAGTMFLASLPARAQNNPTQSDTQNTAGRAQSQGQQPPTRDPQLKPPKEEKKDNEVANPAEFAAEKTVAATEKLGKAALFKARDWESGWLTGVYLSTDQPRVPLTGQEREAIYLQQTLVTPGAYMKRMLAASIDQARDAPAAWGEGWNGYMERFASREGQFITANTLAALGNAKLHYEVRYDQCRCQGFWHRTRHAIVRNFLTYDESTMRMHPQWGLYGGSFGGGLVSTAWKPRPRNAFAEGGRAMLGQAGWGALLNFFIEYSTDINRKIGATPREK